MRLVLLVFLFWFYFVGRWIDGLDLVHGFCRDAGMLLLSRFAHAFSDCRCRIVEYATRDQAQQAIQTLSNQSLMGRLVYVREVCNPSIVCSCHCATDCGVLQLGPRN